MPLSHRIHRENNYLNAREMRVVCVPGGTRGLMRTPPKNPGLQSGE